MPTIDVTAAIIEKDGNILVARRAPGKHLAGYWEFPGGKIKPGETPETCLARELKEELGVKVNVGGFIAESTHDYGTKIIRLLAYSVTYLSGHYSLVDHDKILWLKPESLYESKLAPADVPLIENVIDFIVNAKS